MADRNSGQSGGRELALRALAAAEAARPLVEAPRPPRLGPSPDAPALFDKMVTDPDVTRASRGLFVDGHFARAVEEAFKCLNNVVKRRSGVTGKDGLDLMFHVFDPDSPILRINGLRSQSEQDEQAGYRYILAGCMKGLRNPRAHEHLLV